MVDGEEVNEPILDENGNPEYIYSLRYEEFIALNTYTIQKLWNRVETLEKENAELKDQIKSIQQDITELKNQEPKSRLHDHVLCSRLFCIKPTGRKENYSLKIHHR